MAHADRVQRRALPPRQLDNLPALQLVDRRKYSLRATLKRLGPVGERCPRGRRGDGHRLEGRLQLMRRLGGEVGHGDDATMRRLVLFS
jgi:hypothetical protein